MTSTVYILDDDAQYATLLKGICRTIGIEVEIIGSPSVFIRQLPEAGILILDLNHPECTGFEVIRALSRNPSDLKVILMSGYDAGVLNFGEKLLAQSAVELLESFEKPILVPPLLNAIRKATETNNSGIQSCEGNLALKSDDRLPLF